MYPKGTIILVPFPFTDFSGNKIRPALVLNGHKKSTAIIVIFITLKPKQISQFSVLIKPSSKNGIKVPSIIICDKIATLDQKIIVGKIGDCEEGILVEVNDELKKIFSF